MAGPNQPPAPNNPVNWDTVTQCFQSLLDELHAAYWKANSVAAKDQITEATHDVSDVLTTLYQGELAANTDEYKSLNVQINSVNTDLAKFQAQINNLVTDINIATQVVNAITETAAECAKLFA